MFLFFLVSVSSVASQMSSLVVEAGHGDSAGLAMATMLVGASIGAIILGQVIDKLGPKIAAYVAMGGGLSGSLILLFARQELVLFYIALFLIGSMGASIPTLSPMIIAEIFGQKEFSQIYGVLMMAMALAATIITPIYGMLYDASKTYTQVLMVVVTLNILAIICITISMASTKAMQARWT